MTSRYQALRHDPRLPVVSSALVRAQVEHTLARTGPHAQRVADHWRAEARRTHTQAQALADAGRPREAVRGMLLTARHQYAVARRIAGEDVAPRSGMPTTPVARRAQSPNAR